MNFIPATESDKDYFRELNQTCYQDVVVQQFGSWDETLQANSFELKWPENNFRKIYHDKTLIGGVWIDEHVDYIQIREIQIHPNFQGQGFGSQVLKLEIKQAQIKGKPIQLRVLFKNNATRLYQRLGFSIIGQNEHQYIMQLKH